MIEKENRLQMGQSFTLIWGTWKLWPRDSAPYAGIPFPRDHPCRGEARFPTKNYASLVIPVGGQTRTFSGFHLRTRERHLRWKILTEWKTEMIPQKRAKAENWMKGQKTRQRKDSQTQLLPIGQMAIAKLLFWRTVEEIWTRHRSLPIWRVLMCLVFAITILVSAPALSWKKICLLHRVLLKNQFTSGPQILQLLTRPTRHSLLRMLWRRLARQALLPSPLLSLGRQMILLLQIAQLPLLTVNHERKRIKVT